MDDIRPVKTHSELLHLICEEWDAAEADMKLAEQVSQEVIIPSVNELRYAGRRVVEAVLIMDRPAPDEALQALYRDARFFCHRARHDAIDASVSHMVLNLENMLQTMGPAIILQCYHNFGTFRLGLQKVQDNIVQSRKDRENRQAIYKTVSECDLKQLVELHNELCQSESLMLEAAVQLQRDQRRNNMFGYGGIGLGIVGAIGVAITVAAWKYPHLLGAG